MAEQRPDLLRSVKAQRSFIKTPRLRQRQKLLQQIIKQSTALIFRLQTAEKMQAISSLQKMIKTDSVKKAISWRWTIK
jgi:hypothetical protein